MALSFFKDFEKVNPAPEQNTSKVAEQVTNMSTDDMKAYFDAMKESILSDIKEEINKIKGGQENASSTNVSSSQPDSTESSVDGAGGC